MISLCEASSKQLSAASDSVHSLLQSPTHVSDVISAVASTRVPVMCEPWLQTLQVAAALHAGLTQGGHHQILL